MYIFPIYMVGYFYKWYLSIKKIFNLLRKLKKQGNKHTFIDFRNNDKS